MLRKQQGRAILSLGVHKFESVGRRKRRDELEIAPDKKRVFGDYEEIETYFQGLRK